MKDIKIPFDLEGNLLNFDSSAGAIVWKDNSTFSDTLTVIGFTSVPPTIQLEGLKGTYSMFLSDFIEMSKSKDVWGGSIKGTFTFVKRGANYGLKCIE